MATKAKKETVDGVAFRSVRPVFGFRVAAGREGKLMFYSHTATIVSDPDHVRRCRQYVPQFLTEDRD